MYMSWFSFILSSNFIFLCFKLKIIHYQTREQREIKFKPRIKLNHNTYTWFKRGRFGYWSIATQANHCNEFLRNAQMPKCPMSIANDPFPKQPLWNQVYKAGTKGIQHVSVIFWCSVVTPLKITHFDLSHRRIIYFNFTSLEKTMWFFSYFYLSGKRNNANLFLEWPGRLYQTATGSLQGSIIGRS